MNAQTKETDYNGPSLCGWYELPNGRQFNYARHHAAGEVWGQLYEADRRTKAGTSGWWRTSEIENAARLANYVAPEVA